MIKSTELIEEINKILPQIYPLEKTFENIYDMSHFTINTIYEKLYLPFRFDISGEIKTGKYKSCKIIKINNYDWNTYLSIYMSFCRFIDNPYIQPYFLYNLHMKNKIDILCINTITIKNKIINIEYQTKPIIKCKLPELKIISKENNFYFSSFDITTNKEQIRTELMRLFLNRDKYKSIHIHLENNGGGDSSPGQLLVKCLIGNNKESWMQNVKRIHRDNNKNYTSEWNSWTEFENKIGNYKRIKLLNLDFFPIYDTKYAGKIHLYMNFRNGSASWYTITYLIYAFASKIKRFTKKFNDKTFKFGSISNDSQLVLHGTSSSCSGDGNCIPVKFKDITIMCPTIQFYSRSFDIIDWNRFWIENKN
jgi:hypothetical protein